MAMLPTFFLGNKGEKSIFYDTLGRKNGFLGYKNKKLRKSKNWHFSKGVNPWFLSKNGHFSNFVFLGNIGQANVFYDILDRKNAFLGNIGQANVFYDILERKNAFLGYKKKKLKKSKNWHFSKGVNPWFLSKNDHFFQLCFFS